MRIIAALTQETQQAHANSGASLESLRKTYLELLPDLQIAAAAASTPRRRHGRSAGLGRLGNHRRPDDADQEPRREHHARDAPTERAYLSPNDLDKVIVTPRKMEQRFKNMAWLYFRRYSGLLCNCRAFPSGLEC